MSEIFEPRVKFGTDRAKSGDSLCFLVFHIFLAHSVGLYIWSSQNVFFEPQASAPAGYVSCGGIPLHAARDTERISQCTSPFGGRRLGII